jgi:protein-tyrosine phosphatase
MHPNRILPLAGACNFRDFGGYATADGRRVRWRRLFRSGVMARLHPAAIDVVRQLGLRAVCDLRRTDERQRNPNPGFGPGVRQFEWDTSVETSPIRSPEFARSATIAEARAAMVGMYERIPYVLQPRLAGTFEALAQVEEGGFVVHCTAGKDRTGVAVALVLEALGVPRELVVADYVLTNEAVDLAAQLLGMSGTGIGLAETSEPIMALPPVARAAVLDAHESYITASLDAIETRHGSIEGYLRDELGVGTRLLDTLRARLLE